MIDLAAIGSLSAGTSALNSGWIADVEYDAVLVTASWESRSTSAIQFISGLPTAATIIRFASADPETTSIKDAQVDQFRSNLNVVGQISLQSSLEIKSNYTKLQAWIEQEFRRLKRPLKLLVDISCLPKSYVMFLVGMGFSLDIITRMDFLYSPGRYDLYGSDNDALNGPRSLISVGDWVSYQIPYLNSRNYMRGRRAVYVALGGELALALPFIERLEPDRLRVAFIADTAPESPDQYIQSERVAYEELMEAPNFSHVSLSVAQGTDLASDLLAFARADGCDGVTALAIGCKTHAAGMAIASLAEPKIEVVTRIPAAYKLLDVPPTGTTYLMQIIDRFDPLAYLSSG